MFPGEPPHGRGYAGTPPPGFGDPIAHIAGAWVTEKRRSPCVPVPGSFRPPSICHLRIQLVFAVQPSAFHKRWYPPKPVCENNACVEIIGRGHFHQRAFGTHIWGLLPPPTVCGLPGGGGGFQRCDETGHATRGGGGWRRSPGNYKSLKNVCTRRAWVQIVGGPHTSCWLKTWRQTEMGAGGSQGSA